MLDASACVLRGAQTRDVRTPCSSDTLRSATLCARVARTCEQRRDTRTLAHMTDRTPLSHARDDRLARIRAAGRRRAEDAPPFTSQQADRLRLLLRPPRIPRPDVNDK